MMKLTANQRTALEFLEERPGATLEAHTQWGGGWNYYLRTPSPDSSFNHLHASTARRLVTAGLVSRIEAPKSYERVKDYTINEAGRQALDDGR